MCPPVTVAQFMLYEYSVLRAQLVPCKSDAGPAVDDGEVSEPVEKMAWIGPATLKLLKADMEKEWSIAEVLARSLALTPGPSPFPSSARWSRALANS
jgi:hypothetical protein